MTANKVDIKTDDGDKWAHNIVNTAAPLFKALTIIMIFIVSNLGYSPVGCKTQYLFSRKFWYNKQLVIFFVIYFVINLRSNAAHKGAAPNDLFILSIIVWIMYNVTARLGETWAVLQTPLWPGPLTWFGLITFPLVILFIVNDARRYYISIDQTDTYNMTIKTLYYFELLLMSCLVVLLSVGFYKSYQQQSKLWGKKFRFWNFFFGIEDKNDQDTLCNEKTFKQYDKEIAAATKKRSNSPTTLGSFIPELLILVAVITMTMLMPNFITSITPLFEVSEKKSETKKSWKSVVKNM